MPERPSGIEGTLDRLLFRNEVEAGIAKTRGSINSLFALPFTMAGKIMSGTVSAIFGVLKNAPIIPGRR